MGYQQWIGASETVRVGPERNTAPSYLLPLLLGLLAVGVVLRFADIGARSLWLDEAYSAWFAALSWADLWLLTPSYETHPPFYYSLLKAWTLLFGSSGTALRSLSAAAGIAAIPVLAAAALEVAKLARIERPHLVVIGAAALAALSPRLVIAAQDARPYALLLLAYAAGLLFWLRLVRSFRDDPGSPGKLLDWGWFGLAVSFVLWLHALGVLYAAALFLALATTSYSGASKQRATRLLGTGAICAALYAPCLLMMAGRSGDWSNGWLSWQPARFPAQLMNLYGQLKIDEPASALVSTLAMCGLLAIGIRCVWRRERSVGLGLATLALFPPLAAAIISQAGIPVFLPRTMLGVLAPAYLLAAYALAQLQPRPLLLATGILVASFGANLIQTMSRPSIESWGELALILKRQMKPGDVIWAYPNDVSLPLSRALGSGPSVKQIPANFPAVHAPGYRTSGNPAVVTLDGPMAGQWKERNQPPPGSTIWLVTAKSYLFDPQGEVARELKRGRSLGLAVGDQELKLQALRPAGDGRSPQAANISADTP